MVATLGSVSATGRSDGAPSPSYSSRTPDAGLLRNGAMAILDNDHPHRRRDLAALSSRVYRDSHEHLSSLLKPLHHKPEDLAKRLLAHFGSISAFADADEAELRQCALYGEQWVECFIGVRQIYLDGLREKVVRSPLASNDRALRPYLYSSLKGRKTERLLAIFADEGGYVIREEVIGDGAQAHVAISPRLIFQRALTLNSRRILLAHNHPSGSSRPSKADIEQTRKLAAQAHELGIVVEDHLVIGKRSIVSMKDMGVL